MMNRRVFTSTVSAALLGPSAVGAGKLSLHIGHTGLTWIPLGGRVTPPPPVNPMVDPQYVQAAIRDITGSVSMASSCSATRLKRWRRRAA
jgi:hypothetical protein